jgi:peptidoglycan/xylan/chitin deacetylase (PgdA/CDA1 family)
MLIKFMYFCTCQIFDSQTAVMNATILLFHRVNPVRDVLWDPMAPALFEKIMHFVNKKYEVISLNDLCLHHKVTQKPPLAITFDDGFKDYVDYALPILNKFNFHSTMFVVTNSVEENMPTWTYVMDYLFYNTQKFEIPYFDYGEECQSFARYKWQTKEEQIIYCRKFKQVLKKVENAKRIAIMNAFMNGFDDVNIPRDLMLSWDELRSLNNEWVDIGSHSVSHPPLATIINEQELQSEIKVSGDIIEKNLGYFPSAISYPVGSYNKQVKELSKKAGYKIGLAVDQKLYNSDKQDLFAVPRIELYNDSFLRNKIKIYGVESVLKSMIKR